ncbi:MAG: alcohol dehydrogenase catalytic domain-containing protein [Eubacteriales bacterium]|nr:alcohol dehydrogenase catalytic domain-containing protein [Eubacteriales bacterium]
MRAAKLVEFARTVRDENGKIKEIIPGKFEFTEEPMPCIADNQALLKVLYIGVCASDQQIYHGLHKSVTEDKLPRIMGHEVSARIEAVGANVKNYKVGELVTVEPQVFCGKCYPCMEGRFNVCEHLSVMGVHEDGFIQEYAACDVKYLHHTPEGMDPELAAIVEPLSVGVGSIKRSKRFKGGNVVVVGAGTIGNCVAQAAKQLGAGKVMVTDINQEKLEYALECGIDYAVDTSRISLKEAIEQNFGVRKADVIVDCVAAPPVFQTIIEAARPDSDIIVTGNYKAPVSFEMPRIQRREINIIGHMMYVREDFADAIRLLAEGKINTRKLISQRWEFEQYPEAFAFADAHPLDVMKMVIKVAQD